MPTVAHHPSLFTPALFPRRPFPPSSHAVPRPGSNSVPITRSPAVDPLVPPTRAVQRHPALILPCQPSGSKAETHIICIAVANKSRLIHGCVALMTSLHLILRMGSMQPQPNKAVQSLQNEVKSFLRPHDRQLLSLSCGMGEKQQLTLPETTLFGVPPQSAVGATS